MQSSDKVSITNPIVLVFFFNVPLTAEDSSVSEEGDNLILMIALTI